MTDSPGDAPAVARQRVRRMLRNARQATGLTQRDVANRLGWSLSKVQRIEGADVAVSETDLKALLALFDVVDPEIVAAMIVDSRLARRERWWTAQEYREHLSPGLRKLLQFESVATEIRSYQTFVLPGVLQTPEMAEFIINRWSGDRPDQEKKVQFDVRMLRRKQVIDRPDGPRYHLILDESALKRNSGEPRILAAQLEDLADVTRRSNVFIRIVPYKNGDRIGSLGAFHLLTLGDDDHVLYQELFTTDTMEDDPERIQEFRDTFEEAWDQSLPEETTRDLILATAFDLRADLGRR